MNKKLIFKILGIILGIEGVSLLIPFVIALVCRENTAVFGVTALLCLAVEWGGHGVAPADVKQPRRAAAQPQPQRRPERMQSFQ